MMACRGFLEAYEAARLNNLELPAIFEKRLPKVFDYIAGMTRPNGSLPSVNDSGGYQKRSPKKSDFLAYGARLFDRLELLQTPEGPYAGKSRVFPDAGMCILASGTNHDARWLLFDGGRPGAAHRHDDALSIEVFAHGYPFIVDPGITGYLRDDWTAYYRSTFSHNTIIVNGKDQIESSRTGHHSTLSARDALQTRLGQTFDLVRAAYEGGYRDLPDGIRHTRSVLFVRDAYWIVFDEIAGPGTTDIETRFQFVPCRLVVDRRCKTFRTLRQDMPNMEIIVPGPPRGTRLTVATGDVSPVGGWVSDGEDQPAPQARIRVRRTQPDDTSPVRLVTVLTPFAQGLSSGMRCRRRHDPAAPDIALLDIRQCGRPAHHVKYSFANGQAEVTTS